MHKILKKLKDSKSILMFFLATEVYELSAILINTEAVFLVVCNHPMNKL